MVQSLNTKAIVTLASVLRRPQLIVPHLSVCTVSDIDYDALRQQVGIRAVIFDKDHTLTMPYSNEIHPMALYGIQNCLRVFGKENVAILSNSVGTPDDDNYQNAIATEQSLGIPVIRHTIKKPGGMAEVQQHFPEGIEPSQMCMVGDRVLTDVVFGNLYQMFTVHTHPLNPKMMMKQQDTDNWTARILRPMENFLLYSNSSSILKDDACIVHDRKDGDDPPRSFLQSRQQQQPQRRKWIPAYKSHPIWKGPNHCSLIVSSSNEARSF
jgi:phosphatidylglycerophosphatase GEP4